MRASPVGDLLKRRITVGRPSNRTRRGQISGTSDHRRPPWQSLDTGQALSCRNLPPGEASASCEAEAAAPALGRKATRQAPGRAGLPGRHDPALGIDQHRLPAIQGRTGGLGMRAAPRLRATGIIRVPRSSAHQRVFEQIGDKADPAAATVI